MAQDHADHRTYSADGRTVVVQYAKWGDQKFYIMTMEHGPAAQRKAEELQANWDRLTR